jgi:YHS domain-containing protein
MEIASLLAWRTAFISEESLMQTKICPVCGTEIKDGGVQAKLGGKEVTVCCGQCAKKAQENPAQYAGANR